VASRRVLVTGAAGFLGSHICDRLLADGHEVLGVDNFFTGSRDNLALARSHSNFELIRHDITFPLYVEVDVIFNFACPASPVWYQKDPVQTTKTSVLGMINMLGLAKRVGAAIVQASTSEVYGDPTVHPQTEDYWGNVNPCGPRACYDEGKRVAETLCMDYRRQHQVDARIVRIFNTYGPRMALDDGRVVSNFIVQALRGEPLTVYGTGRQTRSFCYVDDLVDIVTTVGMSDTSLEEPMNIGNPSEMTVFELAQYILRQVESGSTIEYRETPIDDPTQRQPDISKAQMIYGWTPHVGLDEGIARTVDYFARAVKP
jgi:UDP-glucuronate decarboxylase